MSLFNWILILTSLITVVPIFKWAKGERLGLYNLFIFIIGVLIIVLSICKNNKDENDLRQKEIKYEAKINELKDSMHIGNERLEKIGISIDEKTGRLLITDSLLLKKFHAIRETKSISEFITDLNSPKFQLKYTPIPGTESFYVNGLVLPQIAWRRNGRNVTFINLGYEIEVSDQITARYSYYEK